MTTIGPATSVTGDITSDDDLVIEGRFSGQLLLPEATVTITPTAAVEADVRAACVRVRGYLHGNISARDRIELAAGATVVGNLSANQVVLADGARFQGRIDMGQRTIAVRVARYRSSLTA